MTCALIAINTAIYFATSNGLEIHKDVVEKFGEKSSTLSPVTLVTSMFLHGNLLHLIGNMWFLYLFGFAVEGRLRSLKFAGLYLVAGICGALLHHFLIGRFFPDVPSIGASGAIMGVVGAAVYLFPHAKIQFLYSWFSMLSIGMFDVPMWGVALGYVGLDVLSAVLEGRSVAGGVGHLAHIGGAIGGVVICALLRPRRDSLAASEAKAILADSKDLSTLSRQDLADLHKANPEDTTVILNWMSMCLEDNRLTDECKAAFSKALPRIVADQPPLAVASCISMLGAISDAVLPHVFLEVATKVEQGGNPSVALKLYDHALRDSRIVTEDEECALFRSALIYEAKLRDPTSAGHWYSELIRRFPMSPWADQARVRLAMLVSKP